MLGERNEKRIEILSNISQVTISGEFALNVKQKLNILFNDGEKLNP